MTVRAEPSALGPGATGRTDRPVQEQGEESRDHVNVGHLSLEASPLTRNIAVSG